MLTMRWQPCLQIHRLMWINLNIYIINSQTERTAHKLNRTYRMYYDKHDNQKHKKWKWTLARPWKLKVRTYSPFLVSLCRTRNTPWPTCPCWRTSCAASNRDSVPWNQGYSRNICSTCVSSLPESTYTGVQH